MFLQLSEGKYLDPKFHLVCLGVFSFPQENERYLIILKVPLSLSVWKCLNINWKIKKKYSLVSLGHSLKGTPALLSPWNWGVLAWAPSEISDF